ncbi:acyl-CoA dehydrogenase family protein [Streptomyces sp. WI04-05B]|uniref:acyl-CoA dehydrogenase family protein n=1 Tax=Streptomyces TaxID=1883 RepID=UPI0029AC8619|nr:MULTISPECIES: acyl-CoA dehydrogenase family protein [unclassified Streptomyces]MDX2545789.1 acyl-CoA/acyl-ACP dehydrogenase [Streptomyces sp. WI04-05B]MDX2583520.1 acyl-CoA/acyl-ACP dehydrogenase [Streptomyces sp. WI04-05A]
MTARIAELAAGYDRSGTFPADSLKVAHEAGLLTATIGERYGGRGAGVEETARILHTLGQGDPSVALIAAMTLTTHGRQSVQPHWPEELYAQIVKESFVRPVLINHARVEPELGSPARGGLPATRARRTGDGWSVSGTKRFVTGAEGLDWFLVWATTDEPEPRVGTFLVPGDSPGIEVTGHWDQLGLRASGSHDVTFRDVEVPYEHVIGLAPYGPSAEQDNRAGASLHLPLAALYLGVARAAQAYFHTFARNRVPASLGHPVARTERFRRTAGEIEVLLTGAEQLIFGGAARVDAADTSYTPEQALGARVLADRHGVRAVGLAVRLLGNPGLARGNPLERHFRDIQCAPVHAPQEDISVLAIGTKALAAKVSAAEGEAR